MFSYPLSSFCLCGEEEEEVRCFFQTSSCVREVLSTFFGYIQIPFHSIPFHSFNSFNSFNSFKHNFCFCCTSFPKTHSLSLQFLCFCQREKKKEEEEEEEERERERIRAFIRRTGDVCCSLVPNPQSSLSLIFL